jgi:class III poly(R)-hydroxyalkanoic acid synthase PhaE subunit
MSSNPFMDYQQQYFKFWKDSFGKLPGMEAYTKMADAMQPGMESYWKSVSAMMGGENNPWKAMMDNNPWKTMMDNNPWKTMMESNPWMPKTAFNPWEAFAKMMPTTDNNPWKMFTGMMPDFANPFQFKIPGMEIYSKVFDLWQGMSNPAEFARDFSDKYMDLMQDAFGMLLPDGAMSMIQKPMELMQTIVGYYQQAMQPWFQIDEDVMQRIAAGDISAYQDFFKQLNEKYNETLDKFFRMEGLGLNREANADLMKAMNTYNKAMFSTGELMSVVMTSIYDSMKAFVEKYQSAVAEGKGPTTFREFYDLWSGATESALTELLGTEKFARAFDDFSDKYAQFMIAMNKEYERMLAFLPIPTNTDMKSLYKTVYELRKEVRDLKRAVAELQEKK